MCTLEGIKHHFRRLYPNPPPSLLNDYEKYVNANTQSESGVLQQNFLAFLANILRVEIPKGDFLFALDKLEKIKVSLKTDTLNFDKNIPGFISHNILNMPKNRGYVWKTKKFFGKKEKIEGPTVLFEPRRGKTYIHVYELNYHKVYQKLKGQKKQVLIRKEEISSPVPYRPKVATVKTSPKENGKKNFRAENMFSVFESDSE